jgi:hypothetical protein
LISCPDVRVHVTKLIELSADDFAAIAGAITIVGNWRNITVISTSAITVSL